MNIQIFSTGRVRSKRAASGVCRYFDDKWSDDTLPVNVFLIEHPDGLCLLDAGQTADAARPGYFPAWYPFFKLARFELDRADEASSQLEAAGFNLTDVRWVVLTHLHTDHFGGILPFKSAEVIVSRAEWMRSRGIGGRVRGYLPQYWPHDLVPRLVDCDGPPIGPFSGSYDVAADGRLLVVPLPGHTRGHVALLARGDPGPMFLLAGDAAHRATELSGSAPEVAEWCRRENVIVLTAHDEAAASLLRNARPSGPGSG